MIGLAIGLLAWPRGARDELRRDVGLVLQAVADTVTATAAAVAAGCHGPGPLDLRLLHALIMAQTTYVQYQSEPRDGAPSGTDWQAALIAGHHALRGGRRLLAPHQLPGAAAPGPAAGAWIMRRAEKVARQYRLAGERFGVEPEPAEPSPGAPAPAGASSSVGVLPALFDTDAWLHGLAADLARIGPAPALRHRPPRHPARRGARRS
ncbi:hypothetical protein AB0K43_31335 [Kitasatospora sp. NPDC049258]|uniref:hypothetical protein n=1 Tax=Kitasatospora sp. NPDC049258 TaxID=3155394 RepID=UPI00343345D8